MDGRLFIAMRLFTGISIAAETLASLERLMAGLRPLARLKWSPVENLHVTTRFIGEWPEVRLGELESALGEIRPAGSFEIKIAGLDYYPNAGRPRVLFAGVSAEPGLIHLSEAINEALAAIGWPREDRAYSPHLTLARIKNENIDKLRERIKHMSNIELGSFEVREFHLYLSKTSPRGSVYNALRTWPV